MSKSSYATVETNLLQSFTKDEVRAVCLGGPWGVGKTYTWNKVLTLARQQNKLFGRSYCYISLFGVNNIEQLKTSIIQNTTSNLLSDDDTFKTLVSEIATGKASGKRVGAKILSQFRKTSDAASTLPYIKNFSSLISPALFYYIKDQVLCFDDLERAGKDLRVRDVCGIISQLCEQKNCKCYLILNDDELGDQAKDFILFFEKTFDRRIILSPSAEECCDIATSSNANTWLGLFKKMIVTLDMTNIRIIKKALYLCIEFEQIADPQLDWRIFEECIKTLIVASWCVFMPKSAPPTEFLSSRKTRRLRLLFDRVQNRSPEPESDEEKDWNAKLENIDFGHTDDLKTLLFESVESGFFDNHKIAEIVQKMTANLAAQDQQSAFNSAWEIYHDSFDDNVNEFAQSLHDTALHILKDILPVNLDNTICILREIDRNDLADDLIAKFQQIPPAELNRKIKLRKGHPTDAVSDAGLQKAYKNIADKALSDHTADQAVLNIITGNFTDDDMLVLNKLNDQETLGILHDLKGLAIRSFASNLSFLNDARSPVRRSVRSKFLKAFEKIAQESKLNKRRVDNLRSQWGDSDEANR